MEKTTEEMANDINKSIKAIKEKVDKSAEKVEFETVKEQLEDLVKQVGEVKGEDLTKALTAIEELEGEITKMKEEGSSKSKNKPELYKFFEKNASEFKEADRNYQRSTVLKVPELMTTSNIVPVQADGWSPLFNNYIDSEVGNVPKPDNFMLELVDVRTQLGVESIYYSDRVNEEGDAEFIGEGTLKPLADAEWKTSKKNIKEVAVRWKFTKRLMNHAPAVQADFREHATELVEQKIDDVALTGDEGVTPEEFDGIATLADAFVVPAELANYYFNANIYDAIMAVATFVRLNNFKGQLTCVLNTVWKAKMQGIKNIEGDYIMPPFVTQDGRTVGEIRVQFQNKMPDDKILLGDMMKYKIVIAENIEYDEGYENDDFSKNLVSRKLEAFMGSYKKDSDAGSIVYDDIATVLTAIDQV